MSNARFIARRVAEANAAFDAGVKGGYYTEGERVGFVSDWVADAISEAQKQAAEERELYGTPEDTPCVQSADLWGTGEGRYHGVIGA